MFPSEAPPLALQAFRPSVAGLRLLTESPGVEGLVIDLDTQASSLELLIHLTALGPGHWCCL